MTTRLRLKSECIRDNRNGLDGDVPTTTNVSCDCTQITHAVNKRYECGYSAFMFGSWCVFGYPDRTFLRLEYSACVFVLLYVSLYPDHPCSHTYLRIWILCIGVCVLLRSLL